MCVCISPVNSDPEFILGPDICGPGTKKVHVIFNYKDKNLLIKRDITCKASNTFNTQYVDICSHLM